MGKIAEFESQPQRSSVTLGSIDAAAAPYQGLAQAAGSAADYFHKQQIARDTAFVSSRAVDLETKATQRFQQWQNDNAGDPLNKENLLTKQIQDDTNQLLDQAPSEEARASLQRMGDEVQRKYVDKGSNWANQQVVKTIGDDLDRSSQQLQANAYRAADPSQIPDLLQQHDTLLYAAKQSLSPEAVKNMKEVGQRQIVSSVVEGMIANNQLGQAKRFLDSRQYDGVLGADIVQRSYELIDRKREQQENLFQRMEALKERDPWSYVAKQGETQGVQPLSFGDQNMQQTFSDREEFVRNMNEKYHMNLPFVSGAEVDRLTDQFMSANPTQATELLKSVASGTTTKQQAMLGSQIFAKEPGLGAALMISDEDPEAARGIIGGMSLLRKGDGGKPITPPKESQITQDTDAYLGAAIEDPRMRIAAREAATALMVRQKFDRGDKDLENYRPADLNAAMEKVIGPVATINGRKTLTFRDSRGHFLDEDQLGNAVDGLNDAKVEKVLGDVPRTINGQPINLQKSRGDITLKAVGDGVYWVYTPEGIAVDKAKRPFRLDLKKVVGAADVKATRPDNVAAMKWDY